MPARCRFIDGLASRSSKLVNGSATNGVSDAQSGFRAYSSHALECLSMFDNGMGANFQILLEASKHYLKICEIPTSCKCGNGSCLEPLLRICFRIEWAL